MYTWHILLQMVMCMSKIWTFMIIFSLIFAIVFGNIGNITNIIMDSSITVVNNILKLIGMMCFWSGIFNVLSRTSAIKQLSKGINKVVKKLFNPNSMSEEAMENISLNVTCNLIGIGNAATVYGIKSMEKLAGMNDNKEKANDNMTMFVLLNTASIQIIPTGIITLRAMYGSNNITCIVLPVILVTIVALLVGITSIKILNRKIR